MDFFVPGILEGAAENNVRIHGFLTWEKTKLFVKLFKATSPTERIKSLFFGNKAMREFRAGRYLVGRGVRTPGVLAVGTEKGGTGRAVLVFEKAEDTESVYRLLDRQNITEFPGLVEELSHITATLHDAKFYHRDYHAGNILAQVSADGIYDLFVIDLHRASHPRCMSGRRGLENIADLLQSVTPDADPETIRRFLVRYREHRPNVSWGLSYGEEYVTRRIVARERRRLKSRTKRCFKNSTDYFTIRSRERIFFGRREFFTDGGRNSMRALGEITALTQRIEAGEGRVIKDDTKARVILLGEREREICVKAYERLSVWERVRALFRMSRGHRSWRAARGLVIRGFSAPDPIALLIHRNCLIPTAVYLVTDSIGRQHGLELDRFILANRENREMLTRCVKAAADLLGSMHRMGVYHRDLKATNIAVRTSIEDDRPDLLLLDLDAVTFGDRVPVISMAKNLAQLYLSTPSVIDGELRRLFFSDYRNILGDEETAQHVHKALSGLVGGENILYVSPDGDVRESAAVLFQELFERQR